MCGGEAQREPAIEDAADPYGQWGCAFLSPPPDCNCGPNTLLWAWGPPLNA